MGEDYLDEWDQSDEGDEWPMASMARLAADIEAGRAEVPRGWRLDRPGPPNDMPWGQRVAHIQDPDGNTVNLTEPI